MLQTAALALLIGLALWSKSATFAALARFVAAGVPIWLVLYLIFKQLRRVAAEQLESAELNRARATGGSDAIFELDDEALLIERNRLRWLIRWMLPGTTVVVCLYLLVGHFIKWPWTLDNAFTAEGVARTQQPTMVMWFVVALGFACFLFAKSSLALARIPSWRLLHSGAIFIAACGLLCLGQVIALMATTSIPWAEPLFAYIVRISMIVLGIELVANLILDFYRPRVPGVVARPSFDSRLLGLIGEPGALAKSIAESVNYQFGFEVSSTWFYQLLQRWLFPIMVVTFVVILALSSVVIVDADEAAVIEHFGRPDNSRGAYLEPGMHLKWPYPIDVVRRAPVRRIREVVIGEATEKEEVHHEDKAILWTETHEYVPELMLLVASPKSGVSRPAILPQTGNRIEKILGDRARGTESVPVSLLMVSMPITYRAKDIHRYLYNYEDPVKLMEAVAYQYLSDYAAGVDMDELMSAGRDRINATLKSKLQERLDELDLGIEVVLAGVRAAHPPSKDSVAETYHKVINASSTMATTIQNAEGEARKILTSVVGTEERAKALDEAIRERDRLRSKKDADSKEIENIEGKIGLLLMGGDDLGLPAPSGKAAALISDARGSASRRVSAASSKVRAFSTEIVAYEAAPQLYKERRTLEMYADIGDVRKYLILADPRKVIIEYQTQQEGGLDRVLSGGVAEEKKNRQ